MIRTTKRSLIAEFFYNETKYREGGGSERIVSEIDKFWKKGKYSGCGTFHKLVNNFL